LHAVPCPPCAAKAPDPKPSPGRGDDDSDLERIETTPNPVSPDKVQQGARAIVVLYSGCGYSGPCPCCNVNCNDGNPCTTDGCQGGTCYHNLVSNPCCGVNCNDGDPCTDNYCSGGSCY
jgi:hypothetical protein